MANQTRLRINDQTGTITNNPLASGGTAGNSANFVGLPAVDSTQHVVVVLDPLAVGNGPEIVYITAHTAGSSNVTWVRGREGTTGVQHSSNTTWIHAPVASDWPGSATSGTRPSGSGLPYQGQLIYETDTYNHLAYTTATTLWQPPWNLAWGQLLSGYGAATGNDPGYGQSITNITNLTVTPTIPCANRRVRISTSVQLFQQTSDQQVSIYIREGTTILNARNHYIPAGTATPIDVEWIGSPTAGAHTYVTSVNTGLNTVDIIASATQPSFILVEDIGPAGVSPA